MDEGGRLQAGTASAALVAAPAALNGEGASGQDGLPLSLQQVQLEDNSQSHMSVLLNGSQLPLALQA